MRVLLLSAYAAHSHQYWRRSLQACFPHWEWTVLELPPRYFGWRIRGNPLFWSIAEKATLERGDYNLLLATSMVDLATLRGLVPAVSALPTVLYFHENQFAYPQSQSRHSLLEPQMVSLYSAMAADRLVFNSRYNRDTFLTGVKELLAKFPDRVPPGISNELASKAEVLPVPLMPQSAVTASWPGQGDSETGERTNPVLRLLWVGRFEHDKGGEGLLATLSQLRQRELPFELAVIGPQFRNTPAVFDTIAKEFNQQLCQFGYVEDAAEYRALLAGADIVLATALHEFQGLAVLEAVAAGCIPVVPQRLVYPELYAQEHCYASKPDEPMLEAAAAAEKIIASWQGILSGDAQAPNVTGFYTGAVAPAYAQVFTQLLAAFK